MSLTTFAWTPSLNMRRSITPRTRVTAFGDGYRQRVGDGLNTTLANLQLTFDGRNVGEIDQIEAFLAARAGTEAFLFPAGGDAQARYICPEFSRVWVGAGRYTLTATFEQVADPV